MEETNQKFQVEVETGEIMDAELLSVVEIDGKEYAVYSLDNKNGTGVFLGQNQTSNPAVSQVNSTYTGVLGALRPKIYHQAPQPQSTTKYVNLPSDIDSWAYYNPDVAPVKKNALGTLNTYQYGLVN